MAAVQVLPPQTGSKLSPLRKVTAKMSELIHHYHEKHPEYLCERCGRKFTWHPHRPSDLPMFYRDKCNYYHHGTIITGEEATRRFGNDLVRRRNPTGVPEKVWSCCLRIEDGRSLYGGCSFSSYKHVPAGNALPQLGLGHV